MDSCILGLLTTKSMISKLRFLGFFRAEISERCDPAIAWTISFAWSRKRTSYVIEELPVCLCLPNHRRWRRTAGIIYWWRRRTSLQMLSFTFVVDVVVVAFVSKLSLRLIACMGGRGVFCRFPESTLFLRIILCKGYEFRAI